jgi:hypothetical protein
LALPAALVEPPAGVEKVSPIESEIEETVLQEPPDVLSVLTATASTSPELALNDDEGPQVEEPRAPLQIVTWFATVMLPLRTVSVSPEPPQGVVKPLLFPSVSVNVACQ